MPGRPGLFGGLSPTGDRGGSSRPLGACADCDSVRAMSMSNAWLSIDSSRSRNDECSPVSRWRSLPPPRPRLRYRPDRPPLRPPSGPPCTRRAAGSAAIWRPDTEPSKESLTQQRLWASSGSVRRNRRPPGREYAMPRGPGRRALNSAASPATNAASARTASTSMSRRRGTRPIASCRSWCGFTATVSSRAPAESTAPSSWPPRAMSCRLTFNYRLGALGFLAHPALNGGAAQHLSGNFGLEDQQAALRWVHRNAAAFGGDAGNVTIFGESAGGMSVCAQLASPGSVGLFQRAIIQSGPCTLRWPYSPTWAALPRSNREHLGIVLAKQLGCGNAATAANCLRDLPVTKLIELGGSEFGPGPTVGGGVLPVDPARAIANGQTPNVPVMQGTTRDEHITFVDAIESMTGEPVTRQNYAEQVTGVFGKDAPKVLARYPLGDVPPAVTLSAVLTDYAWGCTALQTDRLLAQQPTHVRVRVRRPASTVVPRRGDPGLPHWRVPRWRIAVPVHPGVWHRAAQPGPAAPLRSDDSVLDAIRPQRQPERAGNPAMAAVRRQRGAVTSAGSVRNPLGQPGHRASVRILANGHRLTQCHMALRLSTVDGRSAVSCENRRGR